MAVCVFGYVSYQKLALTLMPDVSYPTLTVRTEYPGTAPQEVENQISERLEEQLAIIPKLNDISSISKAGQSDIILEFQWGADMNEATQDIREKLDRVRLPRDAKRPLILRYDPSLDPIMRIGLTGPYSLDTLRIYAEDIVQRGLEGEEGIAAVRVKGGLEEEYQVAVDEKKLVALGLDIQQVNSRLSQNNVNLPGGRLYEGKTRYVIRTLNELQNLEEIKSIVVAKKGSANITLEDIATVTKGHKEIEVVTAVNGQESIEIEINKEADANIVKVAENVIEKIFGTEEQQAYVANMKSEAEREREWREKAAGSLSAYAIERARDERSRKAMTGFLAYQLPEGCELQVLTDQSIFIKRSIEEVKGNAIVGGLISVFVIFLFLRKVGPTAIIGITIPVSIVATFAPMQVAEVSLNIISLGGLALGVGMLVDNSIVVLESVFRCREEGDKFVQAAVRGVSEVGGAVVASTLTTIAVFFPIVFVEGVASQIFGDMSMTVVFSLLASLVVALYFIPMLASRHIEPIDVAKRNEGYWNWYFLTQPVQRVQEGLGYCIGRIKNGRGIARGGWSLLLIPGVFWFVFVFLVRLIFRVTGKAFGGIILLGMWFVKGVGLLAQAFLRLIEPFLSLFDHSFKAALIFYRGLLNWALNNKVFIVGGAFISFGLSVYFILPRLGSELIPKVHQGEFNLDIKLPIGTKIEDTARIVGEIEAAVLDDERVVRTAVDVGADQNASSGSDEGEHTGQITVLLREGSNQKMEEALLLDIRDYVSNIPDVSVEVSYPELFSVKAPLELE
ncbi:MAG: efflux RND transporter permease subunit, partial [Verrucomicrobiota bacterium]